MSLDGDSVNIWAGLVSRRNSRELVSDFISFNVFTDKNWERGDRYTLSVKGINTHCPVTLNMAVDYNDGTTEYRWFTGPAEGMNRLLLVLDSGQGGLHTLRHHTLRPAPGEVSYLDSITLCAHTRTQ